MPEIFANSQPPAWLQEAARPADARQLGADIGTLGAGLFNSLSNDESFSAGVGEARASQKDPMWRLKAAQEQATTLRIIAGTESQWQDINQQKQDTSDWMTVDMPAISEYQQKVKTNPDTPLPIARSSVGRKVVDQLERNNLQQQAMDFKKANAKSTLEKQQYGQDFDTFVSALDPTARAAVRALPNGGFIDQQRMEPSQQAIDLANAAATDNGKRRWCETKERRRTSRLGASNPKRTTSE